MKNNNFQIKAKELFQKTSRINRMQTYQKIKKDLNELNNWSPSQLKNLPWKTQRSIISLILKEVWTLYNDESVENINWWELDD